MKLFNWSRPLLRSDKGNVLAIVAACMPLIVGAAAVGVDTIQLTLAKRQLQRAADAGALAGAYALVQSKAPAAAVDRDLTLNNNIPLSTARVVENAPTAGAFAGNTKAVRVVLTAQRQTPFWAFFNRTSTTVNVEATAQYVFQGQFCMISLDNTNTTGVTFSGSATVNLGCGVATNSTGASGISAGGSSTVIASPIAAVGGVPSSSHYASGTVLLPYSPPQPDPYTYLPRTPSPPTACTWVSLDVGPNGTLTIATPATGSLCVSGGANIKGTLNLPSDTPIYFDGGTVNFGSQANVTGAHTTLIFTSSTPTVPSSFATISMNGGAQVNLTAPTSGPFAKVIMYEDPRAPFGSDTINGNSSSVLEGGLYFPSRTLTFNGTTGMQTNCLQLVAYRLNFTGNSTINNTCDANGPHAFDGYFVKLVA